MKRERKKIVFFVHCYPPALGGTEKLTGQLKELLDDTYDIQVITGQGTTLDSYKTFTNFIHDTRADVHRLPLKQFPQRLANKLLNKIIFKIQFFSPWYFGPLLEYSEEIIQIIRNADLIVGFAFPTMMTVDAWHFARRLHKPLVLVPLYHNVSYYNKCYWFQQVISYAQTIVFQTEKEQSDMKNNYRVLDHQPRQLAVSSYSKTQLDEQEAPMTADLSTRIKRLSSKKVTLGYIGQITKRKNLGVLKQILKRVRDVCRLQGGSAKLLLAGARTNTSKAVEKIFKDEIEQKLVTIRYDFDDPAEIYKSVDIMINPSIEESLGIVNFEALFYGVPFFIPSTAAFAPFAPTNTYTSIDNLDATLKKWLDNPKALETETIKNYRILYSFTKEKYRQKWKEIIDNITLVKTG